MIERKKIHFYLFRHGETDWNLAGRIQGHLDIPLNETGRQQATRLITRIKQQGIEVLLSSDLRRAESTARIIATPLNLPLFTDRSLREIHLGALEGMTWEEIQTRFGTETTQRWRTQPFSEQDVLSLGSETGEAVTRRTRGALEKFALDHAFTRIGVVTHGGVIRRFLQEVMQSAVFPPPIPNGSLYPLTFEPGNSWSFDGYLPLLPIDLFGRKTKDFVQSRD